MSIVVDAHMGVQLAVLWVVVLMSVFQGKLAQLGSLLEATHLEFVGKSYDWSGKGKGKQGVGGENIDCHRRFRKDQAEEYNTLVVLELNATR